MPKIDIDKAPRGDGTTYPDEFAGPCLPRQRWKLGDAAGLRQGGNSERAWIERRSIGAKSHKETDIFAHHP